MQIVIEIPEEVYKRTLPYKNVPVISNLANDYPELTHAVSNGTPLPKGHGRLIDADELKRELINEERITDYDGDGLENIVDWQPTIIEADKAESEV